MRSLIELASLGICSIAFYFVLLLILPHIQLLWQAEIKRCALDMSASADEVLAGLREAGMDAHQEAHILALRGLLGCHLLDHALQKRHCVDYGINRCQQLRTLQNLPMMIESCNVLMRSGMSNGFRHLLLVYQVPHGPQEAGSPIPCCTDACGSQRVCAA